MATAKRKQEEAEDSEEESEMRSSAAKRLRQELAQHCSSNPSASIQQSMWSPAQRSPEQATSRTTVCETVQGRDFRKVKDFRNVKDFRIGKDFGKGEESYDKVERLQTLFDPKEDHFILRPVCLILSLIVFWDNFTF